MPNQAIRFSLFSLFLCVSMIAIGVAALASCTHFWLCAVGTLSLMLLLVALSVAVHATGPQRAFALGCIAWGITYLAVVYFVLNKENDGMGKIATTYLLKTAYGNVAKPIQIVEPGWGPRTSYEPDHDTFMQIGQLLWAWLFALCGGIIGRLIHLWSTVQPNTPPCA